MTVQKDVTKNIYVGNGSTRTFPFTFECPAEHPEYIKVYLMQDDGTALATSDYQLDMDARQITYPSSGTALTEGKKLVIMRELPLQQMMNLVNNGPYFAEDVELAFDENVMAMQQIAEKLNRSIIMSVDIDGDAFVNEVPFEPGKSFRIADDGKSIVLTEDPARVLPLAENTYAQAKAQAQSAYASAVAAAKSEDSAAESARLVEGYKDVAETAKSDASLYANNAKTSADNATASKEVAQSAANSASNFATDARSSANEAKSYRDASSTYATNAKNYSENVNVFVPSVSAEGVLSWSNKAGLTNPPSVNIKGKDGADGGVTVDAALSDSSTNPVQNKVIKAALDNRAVLDDANTFTSPNRFDDIYMQNGINSLKWYDGSPNFVVGYINSKSYTGEANTAKKATQDGAGNVITDTYAKKTDISGVVKSVNGVQPDTSGNVTIAVSGGSNITIDNTLSDTSTNPVQNKVIKTALDNRAVLDESNVFTNQNIFASGLFLTVGNPGGGDLKWCRDTTSVVVASLNDTNYTGNAATATKATQDSAGNVITDTYATKTELNSYVKSVNNITPDTNGNVVITVGSDVIVDNELSNTSTNPVQNKVVYEALDTKLGKNSFAYGALRDAEGNFITSTYVRSVNGVKPDIGGNVTINVEGGGSITVDTELSSTSTNAIANKAVYDALLGKAGTDIFSGFSLMGAGATINWRQGSQPVGSINATNYTGTASAATHDGAGNVITETYTKKADFDKTIGQLQVAFQEKVDRSDLSDVATSGQYSDLRGKPEYVVQSVNNVRPDENGNVSISVSGGGGVSTSESNTWTGKQTFQKMKFNFESYNAPRISGATDNPSSSVAVYNVQGNFTLDMSTLAGLLSNGDATVFTAYITANGSYALSITNAGTLKYAGSAADLAITASGLLLNVFLTKNSSGVMTSIAQATKLS